MSAELRKLAKDLQTTHPVGARLLRSFGAALFKDGLIPPNLTIVTQPKIKIVYIPNDSDNPFPPYTFQEKPSNLTAPIFEIDSLDQLPPRIRNCLVQGGVTSIRELADSSDSKLLNLRNFGVKSLPVVQRALDSFKTKLLDERRKLDLPDHRPLELPYPTRSRNSY